MKRSPVLAVATLAVGVVLAIGSLAYAGFHDLHTDDRALCGWMVETRQIVRLMLDQQIYDASIARRTTTQRRLARYYGDARAVLRQARDVADPLDCGVVQ